MRRPRAPGALPASSPVECRATIAQRVVGRHSTCDRRPSAYAGSVAGPALTEPLEIGGVRFANRVLLAPLAGIGNWFVRLQASRHGAGGADGGFNRGDNDDGNGLAKWRD